MIAVLNWLLNHWYVFFWLAFFGVFKGIRDSFVGMFAAVGSLAENRHQRRLELAQARQVPTPAAGKAPLPGPCAHRRVKQVRNVRDELVGWLCAGCDTQLPADWAVAEEDLP